MMELSIIDKQEERIAFSALEVGDLFVRWDLAGTIYMKVVATIVALAAELKGILALMLIE
ncbi:hypothetical protein ACU41F_003142 [Klebsiella aerogenes]